MVAMTDRLRELWDFSDLASSEQRFRDQLGLESTPQGRAEVLTQLARIEGLRNGFERGEALIKEAEGAATSPVVRSRIDLERGRLLRSSGRPQAALPLFESAFAGSLDAGEYFIAVDAAHMAALAAPDHEGFVVWTQIGIAVSDGHPEARSWLGPLLNNFGWQLFDSGDLDGALDAFRKALESRLAETENQQAIALARYAVGKTLRALWRPEEAVPLLEGAVAWAEASGAPDGWFCEELAEEYSAVGRHVEASEQAGMALRLLPEADLLFTSDPDRVDRLRSLAKGPE